MSRINDLTQQQLELLDKLFWLDENSEEDAQEIELLKKELLTVKHTAGKTLNFLSGLLLEAKAILEGREEVKRRAERRRKTAESAVRRLTTVIEFTMERFAIDKIELESVSFRMQLTPGALEYAPGFDVTTLPEDCFKVTAVPVASAIAARIKDGEVFEGVSLVKKETLRLS